MEAYIDNKKQFYAAFIEFLENPEGEMSENNKLISSIMVNQQIEDREEMHQFLLMIRNICDNHHRNQNFISKLNQILNLYKDQIKQSLSNIEIYHIFENNKILLLFLLKSGILTISKEIYNEMIHKIESNGNRYCHFFYPEIENFIGESKIKEVKNELLTKDPNFFDKFDEKRQEGENDSYICSLIRQDSIIEFISYVSRTNLSLSSTIPPSIYETNSLLIENKDITLIEYSAFYGSIQIFQYLLNNNVDLTPSLWVYSIHSKNPELIHILETNNVPPPMYENIDEDEDTKYFQCFIESIKCHHNDIANYIESNFLLSREENKRDQKMEIISNYIKYYNYSYFQVDSIVDYGFFDLCFYEYYIIVDLFLSEKEDLIKSKISISTISIQ